LFVLILEPLFVDPSKLSQVHRTSFAMYRIGGIISHILLIYPQDSLPEAHNLAEPFIDLMYNSSLLFTFRKCSCKFTVVYFCQPIFAHKTFSYSKTTVSNTQYCYWPYRS
jgi:hypothetical protein